ncbi:oligosaccharide flippase family protein [Virgibacillus flavescens]|uniref:oligosaccharide flippase family protein n=1 Tax=Virgibacillus flavescens TaxID=1611422 RepID=UPI003D33A7E5
MKIGNNKSKLVKNSTLSLRKNFSWTIVGNLVAAICKWGILVVLAKFSSPKLLGQFTLAYAIAAPIFMFMNLQLRAIQATDVKNQYKFSDYFKLRTISNTFGFAMLSFILLLILNYDTETVIIILVVGVIKLFESISDVFYGQMQKKERMDLVSKSMMFREISGLFTFAIILIITNSLLYSLIGFSVVFLLVVIYYDFFASLKLESLNKQYTYKKYIVLLLTKWDILTIKKIFLLALPLGCGVFIGSLVTNIPRYLVDHFLGKQSLGYFAAIGYFAIGFSTLFNAIGQATRPRLSKYFENNFNLYKNLLIKIILLSGSFGLAFFLFSLLFGKGMLSFVYSTSYSQYWSTLIWISIAVFFLSINSILQIAIQSARIFNVQIYISIISLVTVTIAGFFLIPKYGIEGGGFTLLVYSIINTLTTTLFFFKFVYSKK